MTLDRIFEDIRTDRVKKIILDSDMANEMDDQYALAYCIGSKKLDLLSVNAAPFHGVKNLDQRGGMLASYNEAVRILEVCQKLDEIPVYEGSDREFTSEDNFAPIDSPAARNIIKTVKESDEIVYVLTTGCCPNIISAYFMDPSIAENMCVIWLGGNTFENVECTECNLYMDYRAGQFLMNLPIPLLMLPAVGPIKENGTQVLSVNFDWLRKIKGDKPQHDFFRKDFPIAFYGNKIDDTSTTWSHTIWDVAAPAVLTVPDAFTFKIIPAPIFGDDEKYAFDDTRRKIAYMVKLDKNIVLDDCFEAISNL